MKEYIEDELDEMKEPFVVVDTADLIMFCLDKDKIICWKI